MLSGARGLSHIGVLRALDEAGVPIDLVGGSSIGGILGAMYAMGKSHEEIVAASRFIWIESRPFRKLTLPAASVMRAGVVNALYRTPCGDTRIEDLPIGFFCVSSNLSRPGIFVHRARGLSGRPCAPRARCPG